MFDVHPQNTRVDRMAVSHLRMVINRLERISTCRYWQNMSVVWILSQVLKIHQPEQAVDRLTSQVCPPRHSLVCPSLLLPHTSPDAAPQEGA